MTTLNNKVQHLDNLCVVHVEQSNWSGQTRLDPKDIKLGIGGEVPSDTVFQLGSKKVCDPERLKAFTRIKSASRRLLKRHGLPFMNGWAVPIDKVDEITQDLNEMKQEFQDVKNLFLNDYDLALEEWIRDNPDHAEAIRAGALPKDVVEKRISFNYQVFMIQPVSADPNITNSLNEKVVGLGDELIDEIVNDANRFFDSNLRGRTDCGVTTRLTLTRLRDKIDGLSFLNASFDPLVNLLDETLSVYDNADGRNVRSPYFYQIVAATLILGSHDKINEYANGLITLDDQAAAANPDYEGEGENDTSPFTPLSDDELKSMFTDHIADPATEQEPESDDSADFVPLSDDELKAMFGEEANAISTEPETASVDDENSDDGIVSLSDEERKAMFGYEPEESTDDAIIEQSEPDVEQDLAASTSLEALEDDMDDFFNNL